MSLVRNEQTKLTATAVSSVVVAAIAVGFVTPVAAASFGARGSLARGGLMTTVAALAWLVAGAGLHLVAIRIGRMVVICRSSTVDQVCAR